MSFDRRNTSPDLIGQFIPNQAGQPRYRVEHPIGSGGQAWVFKAIEVHYDRPMAIKILKPDEANGYSEGYALRFEQEAKMTAKLTGDHTVTLFEHGPVEIDGFEYLVMVSQYVDGITLHHHIARHGAFTPRECSTILRQITESLAEAHAEGFIHRDLKSVNVMLADGPRINVRVLDFGIGKAIEAGGKWDSQLTAKGDNFLSPMFAAPEQILKNPLGPPTDLYALGVIAYHCLVGHHPYQHLIGVENAQMAVLGHVVSADPIRLPGEFEDAPLAGIVHKLLEKDVSRRYKNCQELQKDLDYLETSEQRRARRNSAQVAVESRRAPAGVEPTARLGEPTAHLPEPTERLEHLTPTVMETPHATVNQAHHAGVVAQREFDDTRAIRSGAFDPLQDKKTDAFVAPTPEAIRDAELKAARAREDRVAGASVGPQPVRSVAQRELEPSSPDPEKMVGESPVAPEATERVGTGGGVGTTSPARAVALVLTTLCLVGGGVAFFSGILAGEPVSPSTSESGAPAAVVVEEVADAPVESSDQSDAPDVVGTGDVDLKKAAASEATTRSEQPPKRPVVEPVKSEAVASGRRAESNSSTKATRKQDSRASKDEPKSPDSGVRVVDSSGTGEEPTEGKKTNTAEPTRETTPAPEPERAATPSTAQTGDGPEEKPAAPKTKIDLGFGGIN